MGIEAFGVAKIGGEWRPVLQRYKGPWPCKKCRGFGNYGNPLIGVIYECRVCKGSGKAKPPLWWSLWQAVRGLFKGTGQQEKA